MRISILDELINANRMPVLFIGSGISKRYLYGYPSWGELLEKSFAKFEADSFQYQKHIDECKRNKMSDFETNTYMGTLIEKKFNEAFFDRRIKLGIGNNKNPSWVKRGISPYKMYLADLFKKQKLNHSPELQEELIKFRALKNKVSAVITTNYDTFLENEVFSKDFQVYVRQHELFSSDSYNIAEIYKIHGSATDAESIVITEDDYKEFKESRKLIIAKMLTLFAESPIVFLGYSMTDEDVRCIIEDFLSCLSTEQLRDIRKHFVFVSHKKDEEELIEVERTIFTKNGVEIPFVEIQTDNYLKIYEKLGEIIPGISPVRVRETRKVVKAIVDQCMSSLDAESTIVGIDDLEQIDLSTKPLAIAIGYRENILSKYGYGRFEDKLIYEDIIYNNKNFDQDSMCEERLRNIKSNRLLPVYKYVKGRDISQNGKLYDYIQAHNTMEKIISSAVAKSIKNIPVFDTYDQLREYMDSVHNCRKAAMAVLKNIEWLSIDSLREACKYLFEKFPDDNMADSNYKRCVMCLDFKENYE